MSQCEPDDRFRRNRAAVRPEVLEPYRGLCVTWDAEGTRILAAGVSWADLYAKMRELDIDPRGTVDEYIADLEERSINPHAPSIDTVRFDRNRQEFPEEQLQPYWGMHVAWNAEGTAIVASGKTVAEVHQRLRELYIDPSSTVADFVEDPHVIYSRRCFHG